MAVSPNLIAERLAALEASQSAQDTALASEITDRGNADTTISDSVTALGTTLRSERDALLEAIDNRPIWIVVSIDDRNAQDAIASEGVRVWVTNDVNTLGADTKWVRTGAAWVATTEDFTDIRNSHYAYFGTITETDVDTFMDTNSAYNRFLSKGLKL